MQVRPLTDTYNVKFNAILTNITIYVNLHSKLISLSHLFFFFLNKFYIFWVKSLDFSLWKWLAKVVGIPQYMILIFSDAACRRSISRANPTVPSIRQSILSATIRYIFFFSIILSGSQCHNDIAYFYNCECETDWAASHFTSSDLAMKTRATKFWSKL